MKMRLSNSDYWDLFLCYDCTDSQDNDGILSECILVDIDINNDDSFSGDTVCSLTSWSGATVYGSGVTLYDIGLTGIDNGLIVQDQQVGKRFYLRLQGQHYSYLRQIQSFV
jgi:hypothetical protein